jgi:hypothetical protein
MAVLSSQDRKSMPKGEFAGPGRSFPVNDATHARMAISGATRSEHAGNISSSEEASIKAKARAKLGEKGGSSKEAPPHGDCPGGAACKAAMDKVHPGHAHKMMEHAASGKAGPEMQQMAQQAMQGPAPEENQEPAAPQKPSMFSGEPDGDEQEAEPAQSGSMFSGGR